MKLFYSLNKKMKKIFFVFFLCFSITLFFANIANVFADASAYVTWTAPATDEGGGELTGLAGYRVYYDSSSNWASTCPTDAGTYVDVADGETEEYFFNNNLTPGETYYFTVMAYDDSDNLSACAQTVGSATEVSQSVSYSGDIEGDDHDVDIFDYTLLISNYGTSNAAADINRNGAVGIFDYTILKGDYGSSF